MVLYRVSLGIPKALYPDPAILAPFGDNLFCSHVQGRNLEASVNEQAGTGCQRV